MNKFLEKFWLVIAIIATLVTLYLMFQDGIEPAKYYILLTGMVWAMFLIRRGIRIRLEKIDKERKESSIKSQNKKEQS